MALSSDPYEQKLYHMFQSHGTGDGSSGLDREALLKLCLTLELKERGHLLVKCLLSGSKTRVSFREFREGLLNILGEFDEPSALTATGDPREYFSSLPSDRKESYIYSEDSDLEQQQQQQQQQHQHHNQKHIVIQPNSSVPSIDTSSGGNGAVNSSSTSGFSSKSGSPLFQQPTVARRKDRGRTQQPSDGGVADDDEQQKETVEDHAYSDEDSVVPVTDHSLAEREHQKKDAPEEVSDREVSPRFVVGKKKYGRRSRPRRPEEDVNGFDTSSMSSNSDNESINLGSSATARSARASNSPPGPLGANCKVITGTGAVSSRVHRSASQSDIHGSKRRRQPMLSGGPGAGSRLKRCASLPTHRQRPSHLIDSSSGTHREHQLHMDDERIDQKIYFMNLSENLREIWNSLLATTVNADGQLNQLQLEQVCERVGLQNTPARLAAQEVFSKLALQPHEGIRFGEFIGLLERNTDLLPISEGDQQQLPSASDCSVLSNNRPVGALVGHAIMPDWTSEIGSLAASIIIDMWESAGIPSPGALLDELGFDKDIIQVADLVQALEEEHQRLISDRHHHLTAAAVNCSSIDDTSHIVRASLALHKAEVNALRQAFHQLVEENKKLYADNKEVNQRAILLAQEVDERHNSLETATRNKIRHLKQRHHESMKELSSQLSFEREQLSHANAALEQRIASLETEECKLRTTVSRLSEENEDLRQDQENLTKEITELLEKNIKLNRDIAELEENNRTDYMLADEDDVAGATVAAARKDSEAEVLDLIDRISLLQRDNTGLRDKNDELNAEIELLTSELSKFKLKRNKTSPSSVGSDEPPSDGLTVLAAGSSVASVDAADVPGFTSATKRRGDSPSKARFADDSPRLGKLRKCSSDNDNESDSSSGDWMALHSELNAHNSMHGSGGGGAAAVLSSGISSLNEEPVGARADEELRALRAKVEDLEAQLLVVGTKDETQETVPEAVPSTSGQSAPELKARCEELEQSLEQMRKEYEDCEDYWQAKVNEERQLYEEEQRVSDDKFAELLKKMAEYEEQFAVQSGTTTSTGGRNGRLSPIDEKDGLEQQYLDLEADFEQMQLALEEKTHEAEKLRQRVLEMEQMANQCPSEMLRSPSTRTDSPEGEDRPASSPISYLWNQSTIQRPVRDYQNPNWKHHHHTAATTTSSVVIEEQCVSMASASTDELSRTVVPFDRIISPLQKPAIVTVVGDSGSSSSSSSGSNNFSNISSRGAIPEAVGVVVSPCNQQQQETKSYSEVDGEIVPASLLADTCMTGTFPCMHNSQNQYQTPAGNVEAASVALQQQLQQFRLVQLQLQDEIKELTQERDGLMMEVQQLKEAKPILARAAYTKNGGPGAHPNYAQKIQHLEQKNRHLQSMVKQQQQYTESILHQIWQQQRSEISDLRNRLEAQCVVISDQAARLTSNDLLVKDMYEENTRLLAQVQRLEHQRVRAKWLQCQWPPVVGANHQPATAGNSSSSSSPGGMGLGGGFMHGGLP
ncbi:blastoderm-specific protein 25D [Anopheles bellator]|uniref:blastoderm-specific protein 25D n=1 Tax=Anopheles bellator TaxID=139047 RepID=UPI0026475733|nr:blastoderm-specific protein 25D [Anopheles bellator]